MENNNGNGEEGLEAVAYQPIGQTVFGGQKAKS
jgi:hypothetical protein